MSTFLRVLGFSERMGWIRRIPEPEQTAIRFVQLAVDSDGDLRLALDCGEIKQHQLNLTG